MALVTKKSNNIEDMQKQIDALSAQVISLTSQISHKKVKSANKKVKNTIVCKSFFIISFTDDNEYVYIGLLEKERNKTALVTKVTIENAIEFCDIISKTNEGDIAKFIIPDICSMPAIKNSSGVWEFEDEDIP